MFDINQKQQASQNYYYQARYVAMDLDLLKMSCSDAEFEFESDLLI